jgi:putative nucleotidyltransferase with HDIG domain
VLIGEKMGLPEKDLETLRIGGLFHDIGKIGISDNILRKETKLSDVEFSEIKHHTEIGERILSNATIFKDIIPIVKYHHERYDGKGYHGNYVGDDIPLMARITAVADSFDAMNSKRPYRDKLEIDVIKDEITRNKGTQFDPKVADVFLNILENNYDKIRDIENKY